VRGDPVTVVLNGKTVVEGVPLPGLPAEGPIGLQRRERPVFRPAQPDAIPQHCDQGTVKHDIACEPRRQARLLLQQIQEFAATAALLT